MPDGHSGGLDDPGARATRLPVQESRRLATLVEGLMEMSRLDADAAPMAWDQLGPSRPLRLPVHRCAAC